MTTEKTLTELLTENGSNRVQVTYPDNKGNHETTVRDLGDRWIGETHGWRKMFFADLINKGVAYSNFGGKYTLVK